jgi:hypothetical protein
MSLFKNEKEIVIAKEIEKTYNDDSEFIAQLNNFSSLVSKNNFKDKIKENSKNPEFHAISENLNLMANNLSTSFNQILDFFDKFQKNDFTVEIKSNQAEHTATSAGAGKRYLLLRRPAHPQYRHRVPVQPSGIASPHSRRHRFRLYARRLCAGRVDCHKQPYTDCRRTRHATQGNRTEPQPQSIRTLQSR